MRIQLVEDNPGDARLIREMLKPPPVVSFELSCAGRLAEVLGNLARETYDILLLDLGLPDSQGLETFRRVNAQAPNTPIIIFTGMSDERLALEAVAGGAQDYLVKGQIDGPVLKRTIHYAIERKRAEEALRESEKRFRQLAENIHDVFWMITPDHQQVIYISPAYENIWERSCADLYQQPQDWLASIAPEDRQIVTDTLATLAQGTPHVTVEYRIYQPGGEMRWILNRAFPVHNESGKLYRIAGIARDITERKLTEQRQSAIHAVDRALAESTTLEEASRGTLRALCQNLGWTLGELWLIDSGNHRLRGVELWHPTGAEYQIFKSISVQMTFPIGVGLPGGVWASGQAVWIADVSQYAGFSRKPEAASAGLRSALGFPVRVSNDLLGVLVLFSDTHREPDEELLPLFETLGNQIGQFIRRKQLEEQLRQSQKMEGIGQLAGGVAHDFNNMLTVIQGYAQVLSADQNLNDDGRDMLREVLSAAERAASLTRQLLAFSRKQIIRLEPLNLNEIVAGLGKMLRRIIGEDVDFQFYQASRLPSVMADTGMIEQVVLNLAINARDAMPKGGELVIGTELVNVDQTYVSQHSESRLGKFVSLTVRDTGYGMTPEVLEHIFEPFFTTKDVGKGTGLGLATVYGIVRQHQGWLEVTSEAGKGSCFKVLLPCTTDAQTASQSPRVLPKVAGGNETVLLVEDEPVVRKLAQGILERGGYRVLSASSGVMALAIWDEHNAKIDLLLTDLVMPEGLSGRDLAKKLTEQKPALRVLYTSGYSARVGDSEFILKEGVNFLAKPFQPEAVLRTVRECLNG